MSTTRQVAFPFMNHFKKKKNDGLIINVIYKIPLALSLSSNNYEWLIIYVKKNDANGLSLGKSSELYYQLSSILGYSDQGV